MADIFDSMDIFDTVESDFPRRRSSDNPGFPRIVMFSRDGAVIVEGGKLKKYDPRDDVMRDQGEIGI